MTIMDHPHSATVASSSKGDRRFCILYGIILSAFLGFAFCQATSDLDDHLFETLILSINGLLSIIGQIQSIKRKASIHFISFAFSFLFMSIAPLFHVGAEDDPVFTMNLVIIQASILVTLFTFIGLLYVRRIPLLEDSIIENRSTKTPNTKYLFLFLITALIASTALIIFGDFLFSSRITFGYQQVSKFGDPQLAMLCTTFLISLPLYGSALGLRSALTDRRYLWIFVFGILMLIAGILNNPTIHPRSAIGGVAFFLVTYFSRGKAIKTLAVIILVGILLAPLFQAFRSEEKSIASIATDIQQSNESPLASSFLSYDYDAFQLLCYTIVTVEESGVVWGSNLLGSALFFVPRAWWEGKPPRSSQTIALTMKKYRVVGTDNLSMPLVAEGYYAFHWLGAILISVLYWKIISRVLIKARRDYNSFSFLFQCILTSLALVLLRGAFMIAVSLGAGAVCSAVIPWILIRSKYKATKET